MSADCWRVHSDKYLYKGYKVNLKKLIKIFKKTHVCSDVGDVVERSDLNFERVLFALMCHDTKQNNSPQT